MKNYSVFSLCFDSGKEVSNTDYRSFESILDANSYFFYLIGSHSFLLGDCSSRVPSTTDSSCLKAFCISNGSKSYYFYLQKIL